MKNAIIIIAAILVLIGVIFTLSYLPATPSPVATSTPATSTPPVATSTLPHCSALTMQEVAQEKADALKGIHTYAVVSDCQELH